MKNIIIKILNAVIGLLVLGSALYSIFGITVLYLPSELQNQLFNWLNISPEVLATFSVSAIVNVVLFTTNWITKINSKKQLLENQIVMDNNAITQTQITNEMQALKNLFTKIADSQIVTADKGAKQRKIIEDIKILADKIKGGQANE